MKYFEIPPIPQHFLPHYGSPNTCIGQAGKRCIVIRCQDCLFGSVNRHILKELWDIEPVRSMRL